MDYDLGDTVQLKSGGPIMTVEQVGEVSMTGEPGVWCTWFEKVGNRQLVQRDTFHPATIVKAQRGVVSVGIIRR